MQSLATFFEDNKPLALAAIAAAIVVLVIVVLVLVRLLFGRRLRAAANGRARQPRLGIVDAYDLDRQRQLVLVRRDNVEHLIMIGGPTDVVIESSIVRNAIAPSARDKDGAVGGLTQPSLAANATAAALPPAGSGIAMPPRAAPSRTEPPMTGRTEPSLGTRAEPSMGTPNAERPVKTGERGTARPMAIPDPAAPQSIDIAPSAHAEDDAAQRPAPRPVPMPGGAAPGASEAPRPLPPRPPLPTRPATPRPPLPPRPSLASTLPPRPPRPPLGERAVPAPRPEPASPAAPETVAPAPGPGSSPEVDRRPVRAAPAGPRVDTPAANPTRTIESLESLEEEMAKLLGRPTPPRREV